MSGCVDIFFLFSHTRKSSLFFVLVSINAADARKTIGKFFLLITFSKNEKTAVEVAWKKVGPKHVFVFFSKYVIFNFHHFLSKVAPIGDVHYSKKKLDTTPLKMGQNGKKMFLALKSLISAILLISVISLILTILVPFCAIPF